MSEFQLLQEDDIPAPDRRADRVAIDAELAARLKSHLADEVTRHEMVNQAMKDGEARMESLERELAAIALLISSVKGFIKAIPIVTVVFAGLISIFTWVIIEKNGDIKKTQATLQEFALQNGKILGVLEGVIKEQERASRRLDSYLDRDNQPGRSNGRSR